MKYKSELVSFLKRTGFLPTYSEGGLFLMSLALILLLITSRELWSDILTVLEAVSDSSRGGWIAILMFFIIPVGILYSIFHAFTKTKKDKWAKFYMFHFAIWMNIFSGYAVAMHVFNTATWYFIILSIWNFLNVGLLMWLYDRNYINESSINKREVRWIELLFGSLLIISLWILGEIILGWYWAVTFSLSVGYATALNQNVKKLFPKLYRNSPEVEI
jgi:hypothetical protein